MITAAKSSRAEALPTPVSAPDHADVTALVADIVQKILARSEGGVVAAIESGRLSGLTVDGAAGAIALGYALKGVDGNNAAHGERLSKLRFIDPDANLTAGEIDSLPICPRRLGSAWLGQRLIDMVSDPTTFIRNGDQEGDVRAYYETRAYVKRLGIDQDDTAEFELFCEFADIEPRKMMATMRAFLLITEPIDISQNITSRRRVSPPAANDDQPDLFAK